jgi:hypothetical protein
MLCFAGRLVIFRLNYFGLLEKNKVKRGNLLKMSATYLVGWIFYDCHSVFKSNSNKNANSIIKASIYERK